MKHILPTIVIAQFCCTSLWFAGNSVLNDIAGAFQTGSGFLANLTSAVQFGFISGTLVFALLAIADRFSPSKVFFVSAVIASIFNLAMLLGEISPEVLLFFRFMTGFFLAGIYPVGMKIASDYYQKGLGLSLGYLVGALVLGTALPHLLKNFTAGMPWQYVIGATSALALLGGLFLWLLVPDGPYRKPGQRLHFSAFLNSFKMPGFRSAAFGYFGHMWELYTFWAFVPVMLANYQKHHPEVALNIPLLSFFIIACGGLACVGGGYLSHRFGPKKVATGALFLSGICCLLSPVFLLPSSVVWLLGMLFFWGLVVIADSPQFSTLVAQNTPETWRGTALTIVNCTGFAITIVSIQTMRLLAEYFDPQFIFMSLAIGPALGLLALRK